MKDHIQRLKALGFTLLSIVLLSILAFPQGGTTQYLYDANGRLTGVIAPNGDAAVYHYDPAGNITSIERVGPGGFSVLAFTPQVGTIGDQITLTGVGLDTASSISFNGAPSQIVSASPGTLVTLVPDGAASGLITISGVRGTATTATAFTVVGRVQVTPSLADILPGESVQFRAAIIGAANQQVTWAVNGVTGNGLIGTIDGNGFYQSPSINHGLTVAITAISQADTSVSGQATVRILNPGTGSEVRASAVSVRRGFGEERAVALPVSVARSSHPGAVAISPGVAVQVGASELVFSLAVAVQVGASEPVFSLAVAVQVGASEPVFSLPVSATTGPVVNSVSPGNLTRGSSSPIVLTGQNLSGASAVSLVAPGGGLEQNITVTNIAPSADGTTLSFTATVGTSAGAGTGVVFVVTPNGRSSIVNTGGNAVQVQ
jgi:YD repeat-containing protein